MRNPYEQYQQQVFTTMTSGDMLNKLYDAMLQQLQNAKKAIAAADISSMDKALNKAIDINRYLRKSLDYRYPVSYSLAKLYDFFDSQMVNANVRKDAALLGEIEPLIADLKDTFDQCDKIDRANRRTTSNVV